MPFCAQCGTQVRSAARFCTGCGTPRGQTKQNDREADAVFRTAGVAISRDGGVTLGPERAIGQSAVATQAGTRELDHISHPESTIDIGRRSVTTYADSAPAIEQGGDRELLAVLAPSGGQAAVGTRPSIQSITDELALPPAVLQDGQAAPGARPALLGNLLLAAGIALLVGLVTGVMDWSLGNKALYFTADGVIALLTGLFLLGGLSLLDRWERRNGSLSEA